MRVERKGTGKGKWKKEERVEKVESFAHSNF